MSRKGENIYRRKDRRWEGRYIASYTPDGKAVYRSVYGKSYTEVKMKVKNAPALGVNKGANITLAGWMDEYLISRRDEIKPTTFMIYERYLNEYIKPYFGNIVLRKISEDKLQSFVNSLSNCSPSTVKGIFSFLRKALKTAHKNEYISPVWREVELPKIRKNEVRVFTREEQRKIEEVLDIEENPNDIGILLCLYMGLRVGEVCGLKWEDIDFAEGIMHINRTVQRMTVDGKSILRELPPKSKSSKRKIPIPSVIMDNLVSLKKDASSNYVLNTNRHATDPRVFQYAYKKILRRAGVPYANVHTMRHTFSVRALELGFDIKTLSEILGHSDATITLKTYAHSLDEHKRKSMEKFSKIKK